MKGDESPSAQSPSSPPPSAGLFAALTTPPPLGKVDFRSDFGLTQGLRGSGDAAWWIRGPHGSGKSTLIQETLETHAREGCASGVLQVECSARMRLEEVLFTIGDFYSHLGLADLSDVLGQRTTLPSKLRVLTSLLREFPLCVWLDDFERLAATSGDGPSRVLEDFVDAWSSLDGGLGRLIVTTDGAGPNGLEADSTAARVRDVSAIELVDLPALWTTWGGDPPAPGALSANLHALQVLRAAQRHRADRAEELEAATSPEDLFGRVRALLSPSARGALDLLAAHRRPMSLGTLRAIGAERKDDELASTAVDELDELALLVSGPNQGERLRVHPTLGDVVADQLRLRELDTWKQLHREIAAQTIQAAARARSLWSFYAAFTHLWEAEEYQQAYEIQKMFAEDFLAAGFVGLAKEVFELCVDRVESPYREIVLGNLAIIYKGEGNFDDAIRLYEQSLETFLQSGDYANAARVHHQIGNTKYLKGDLRDALKNYGKSLEIADQIGDLGVSLLAKVQIANLQFSNGQFDDALRAYREALEVADAEGNSVMVIALHIQIAQIHMQRQNVTGSREALADAEGLAIAADDRRSLLKIEQLRGLIAKSAREYDDAVAHFRGAERHAIALGDAVEQANSRIHSGKVEVERLRFAHAVREFRAARATLEALRSSARDTRALDSNLADIDACVDDIGKRIGPEAFARLLERIDEDPADPTG